ncbi:MAG: sigma factor-like helix-turn-helix DNA-binding protein, partial [Planctomycetota bacterium]
RRQKNSPTSSVCELLSELSTVVQEGEDELWKGERRALRSCLQRLPDRMQRLLMLRYGHNLKGKDLADSASIRVGSLRTTLARLRKQLQDCVRAATLESEVVRS